MKMFVGFLTLILALCISGVAAYFSVVGLAAIFSATAGAVIIMGCALEAGKLVTAGWLHSNWSNPRVTKLHKGYMVAATVALMLITALGIYGFLAKGHLEEQTPLAPVELQIASNQADIDAANVDIKSQQTRLAQLDAAVNNMIGNDNAAQGLRYRGHQSVERKQIQDAITADQAKIQQILKANVPLKLQINEVETKLGPVKYVADLFGFKDTESAVRIVILILMFAFDPLAVALVLSSAISIGDGLREREEKKRRAYADPSDHPVYDEEETTEEATTEPEPERIVPEPMVLQGSGIGPLVSLEEGRRRLDAYADWCASPEGKAYFKEHQAEIDMRYMAARAAEEAQDANLLAMLEQHVQDTAAPPAHPLASTEAKEMTDKERLLDILERKPELLQSIVDAIKEDSESNKPETEQTLPESPNKTQSWLETGPTK